MEINQRPTPPNEWLYEQSFVPNPETGEPEEVRSNWCTQHMGEIPDDATVTDWPKYLYHECTDQQRRDWEEQHPDPAGLEIIVPSGKEPEQASHADEKGGEG